MSSVRANMARGAVWMVGVRIAERGLGFVSTLVLVRLLLPEDFGVVAMAMSVIAVLELMQAFSLHVAIIQKPDIERKHLDTAWTLNVLFGAATALAMVAVAEPVAVYYRDERLEAVMYVLAAGWFLRGFENIGTVLFRKELQFDREFWFVFTKRIVSFSATVPLAFWLESYWALVIGMTVARFAGVVLSYLMHHYRPRPSLAAGREMMGFSSWLLINNFFNVANNRVSDFVIGRVVGTQALGLFRVASEISTLPTTELVSPINRAVFPGYARLISDQSLLRKTYADVLGLISLFAIPAGVGVSAVAAPLALAILGPNWTGATEVIAILGLYCAAHALGSNSTPVFQASARLGVMTAISGLRATLLIPLLIVLAQSHGLEGAAMAVLIVAVVFVPVYFLAIARILRMPLTRIVGAIWRPMTSSAAMYFGVDYLMSDLGAPAGTAQALLQLMAGVASGVALYGVCLMSLWAVSGRPDGAEALAVERIIRWLTPASKRRAGHV